MAEAAVKRHYAWWSDEETETLLRLHREGKSTVEIGKILGRSRKKVYSKLWNMRNEGALDNQDERKWGEAADTALMSMLSDNLSIDRISRLTRRPPSFIRERIQALGA